MGGLTETPLEVIEVGNMAGRLESLEAAMKTVNLSFVVPSRVCGESIKINVKLWGFNPIFLPRNDKPPQSPEVVMRLTKAFFDEIRTLIVSARTTVARSIDLVQVHTNIEIGRRIVEQEQRDKGRAEYGKEVLKALAERLTEEVCKGFSLSNLKSMRQFYLQNQDRIGQTLTGQLGSLPPATKKVEVSRKSSEKTAKGSSNQPWAVPSFVDKKSQSVTGQFPISQTLTGKFASEVQTPSCPFNLSWKHYVFLLGIKNPDERSFYEIEACT